MYNHTAIHAQAKRRTALTSGAPSSKATAAGRCIASAGTAAASRGKPQTDSLLSHPSANGQQRVSSRQGSNTIGQGVLAGDISRRKPQVSLSFSTHTCSTLQHKSVPCSHGVGQCRCCVFCLPRGNVLSASEHSCCCADCSCGMPTCLTSHSTNNWKNAGCNIKPAKHLTAGHRSA